MSIIPPPDQSAIRQTAQITISAQPLGSNCQIRVTPYEFDVSVPLPSPAQTVILERLYLQSLARELLPTERVAQCLRKVIPGKPTVEVVHNPSRSTASYRNLITCTRLWQCAVCAAQITERRAAELLQAVTTWHEQAGFVALLTFTMSHHKGEKLADLVETFKAAHRQFKSGKAFQGLAERYGWVGNVGALEVTYGENGWHVHGHDLGFFELLALNTWHTFAPVAKARWVHVLESHGGAASYEHGLDVRDADSDVYDYVAKFGHTPIGTRWTIEREVAKSPTKKAHHEGRTPFQLLADYGAGDEAAGQLFQEYAAVFKGRKQLRWSSGLRALLGLGSEAADESLVEQLDEYQVLATLTKDQWRLILALPGDARADLLVIASQGDQNAVNRFLARFDIVFE